MADINLTSLVEHVGVCGALFVLVLAYFRFVVANVEARIERLDDLMQQHLLEKRQR